VVCCAAAPVAAAIGPLAHTFAPGDTAGLAAAIAAARAAEPDPAAAAELALRHAWPRVFAAEAERLRGLL